MGRRSESATKVVPVVWLWHQLDTAGEVERDEVACRLVCRPMWRLMEVDDAPPAGSPRHPARDRARRAGRLSERAPVSAPGWELGSLFTDDTFAALFPPLGQPAYSPWRPGLATILQYAEGFSDRR